MACFFPHNKHHIPNDLNIIASTYLFPYRAGEEVAMKLIALGHRFYRKYVDREIMNHRQLAHPHIVAFIEVFITSRVRFDLGRFNGVFEE